MAAQMIEHSEFHKRVIEHSSTVMMLFSSSLHLAYINPAGEMMFEMSARHLLGQGADELLYQHHGSIHALLEEAMLTGHPFTRHEFSLSLLQAKDVTVSMTVIPLRQPGGNPELLVEMNSIDRWLRISRDDQRAEQQRVTQEVLRGLAHEIKNPLGGIRGAAQLLEKQFEADELREYTHVIIEEADRLQGLVNRILGPSGTLQKVPVNIHEALERIRSLLLAEVKNDIQIRRDYDPSIPDIHADKDMLIQAVLNIVRNAVEALHGSGHIILRSRVLSKFTIGQQRHRLVACIQVIDDGPGVPEEIRERIFFPMVTSRANGSGLGLAITQTLIEQHNGLVEFESEPGKTVFSIFLPIEEEYQI